MAVQIDQVTIWREQTIHATQISWCLDLFQEMTPFEDARYSLFKGCINFKFLQEKLLRHPRYRSTFNRRIKGKSWIKYYCKSNLDSSALGERACTIWPSCSKISCNSLSGIALKSMHSCLKDCKQINDSKISINK